MRETIVYRLTFPNGKVYIGITREGLAKRIRRHVAYANAGKPFALSSAIRKYGPQSFDADILDSGSWEAMKAVEIKQIAAHNALGNGGYNMTGGGDGMLRISWGAETRAKISASLTGRHCSKEHRANVSKAQRGKMIPLEVRAKMSEAARSRRPMPEEQRAKIRAALLGKKQTPERIARRVAARRANGSY